MIEITCLTSNSGPLTKRIYLSSEGCLISDGSACVMRRGSAKRLHLEGVEALGQVIANLGPTEAIALGALRHDLPDQVSIITQAQLQKLNGSAPANMIARTAGHFSYRAARPAFSLIDIDTKGMPPEVVERVHRAGGFWDSIVSAVPGLANVARVVRTSTSSGISRADTGEAIPGSDGLHVFVLVEDGADIERFLRTIHDRCWLGGLGWIMIGAGGQLLERSPVDRMVYAAERLVFEGAPILQAPLRQDPARRAPKVFAGIAASTRTICPDLTRAEIARAEALK